MTKLFLLTLTDKSQVMINSDKIVNIMPVDNIAVNIRVEGGEYVETYTILNDSYLDNLILSLGTEPFKPINQ